MPSEDPYAPPPSSLEPEGPPAFPYGAVMFLALWACHALVLFARWLLERV